MWTYNHTDELYHHGVKGMKWGRRLYQRTDGSLTALGRLRYGKKSNEKPRTDSDRVETLEEKKTRILKSHSAKDIYQNKDLFTDKEIQDAYNRLNNEKNIKSLIPAEVSKGKKFIDAYINSADTIKKVVDSSSNLYNSYVKGKELIDKLMKASEAAANKAK